jgi:hypothetical protein
MKEATNDLQCIYHKVIIYSAEEKERLQFLPPNILKDIKFNIKYKYHLNSADYPPVLPNCSLSE